MKDCVYIPVKQALSMLDTLSEVLIKEFNEHAVFYNQYKPYHEELLPELVEKIKEAESKKEEWEGFSIIKSFYENDGKGKITVICKVMKVKHVCTHFIDGKYVDDDDDNCLEFSIERV
jgi:hypothetical protein